jgi:hypothetical protein
VLRDDTTKGASSHFTRLLQIAEVSPLRTLSRLGTDRHFLNKNHRQLSPHETVSAFLNPAAFIARDLLKLTDD